MKLIKSIKKIIALGTGLTMLGATVFGAFAADLGNYPSPFIKDGKFNGLMVVGETAQTGDVLGVVDIATSLQFESKVDRVVAKSSSNSNVNYELTGDVYKIGTSSDVLNLNEALGKVKSTITKDNLGILESTRIRTQKGTTDVDQYLKFSSDSTGLRPVYDKNKNNEVDDFLKASNNALMFEYEIQFPEGLRSSAYDSISSNDKRTSGTAYLNDINGENIYILGQNFNIGETTITKDGKIVLTLMAGQVEDTLQEYESKTYQIGDKSYEVAVTIISDTNEQVRFTINGEITRSLSEGDTATLSDGTSIGVTTVLANEGTEEGGKDLVTFYIGANKIELTDPNYTTTTDSGSVKIDENTIDDASVSINAVWTDDEVTINSIKYSLKADSKYSGDLFIAKNETLRGMLDEPDGMLSNNWDLKYLGMSAGDSNTEITITPSGDDSYYLEFTNQEDMDYSIPLVDTSGNFSMIFGTADEKLIYTEATRCVMGSGVQLDDYVIVSKGDDKAFTHVLTFDNVEMSEGILSLSDVSDGSTKDITFDKFTVKGCEATKNDLIVGGESYKVNVCTDDITREDNYYLCIDNDGDRSIDNGEKTSITVAGGGILTFDTASSTVLNMGFTIPAKYTDSNTDEKFTFDITESTDGKSLDVSYNANSSIALEKVKEKGTDYYSGTTTYGVYVEENDPTGSNDAGELLIRVPNQQTEAKVYLIGSGQVATQTTTSSTTGNTIPEYTRIEVGASVLDSEISSMSAQNLIVVGGPCVNKLAAQILGISNAAPECYEKFPVLEGEGIIKIVDNGDKVAMLVAGYSARDTRNAAKAIANYKNNRDTLVGTDVVVKGDIVMKAPTAVVSTEDTNTTSE